MYQTCSPLASRNLSDLTLSSAFSLRRLISVSMFTKSSREISPPAPKRRRASGSVPGSASSALVETLPSRPITELENGQVRVFTWNVDGIAPFLQKSIKSFFPASPRKRKLDAEGTDVTSPAAKHSSPSLRDCLRRWKWPQVLCLQEVKIARGDVKTQNAARQAVRAPVAVSAREPSYSAFFSLPRDKHNARGFGGKVYGVCTLVRDDLIAEYGSETETVEAKAVDWDLEGRVLVLRLPQARLLILNVYAVNGTDNPYRDPETGIETGTRHDHKRAFHMRLRDMVGEYERDDWSVIVAGDLNIARTKIDGFPGIRLAPSHVQNRADFDGKFMQSPDEGGLGMVDTFRSVHGPERKYTYRSPSIPWGASCDRVDLILLSRNAVKEPSALIEADILDEEDERGPSDHLPSYVTVSMNNLAEGRGDVNNR